MKVTPIAATMFGKHKADGAITEPEVDWESEGWSAQDLSEFAGRACYQSWSRPNPATASNEGYLRHILEVGHTSVLEHGSTSFYIEGVSRSLTHELVRHRHLSYSQLSQRFVVVRKTTHGRVVPFVTPPLFENNAEAARVLSGAWDYAVHAYEKLVELGNVAIGDMSEIDGTSASKRVREAARAVLPNMAPTAIVVTGNHRAWLEFIEKRASLQADAEIARLAVEVFRYLKRGNPHIYQHLDVFTDGRMLREWIGPSDT